MSRLFSYARVSTVDQTTENQIGEIESAGFKVEPHRMISETVSGSTPIALRKGFLKLLDRMEAGDVLVVTKLDRLGRNAIDVSTTVTKLENIGVRVHCLALGGVDLTSSAGKLTMNVINSVAQFERDLLIERTQAGLKRAKSEGSIFGRPPTFGPKARQEIVAALLDGTNISALARKFKTSRQTIMRVRDEHIVGDEGATLVRQHGRVMKENLANDNP